MPRRLTRQRTTLDRGSSAVEFSLMVAAMAAMILAVVLGVGHVVGDVFFHNCQQFSAQLDAGGACVAPEAPAAGDDGKPGARLRHPSGPPARARTTTSRRRGRTTWAAASTTCEPRGAVPRVCREKAHKPTGS